MVAIEPLVFQKQLQEKTRAKNIPLTKSSVKTVHLQGIKLAQNQLFLRKFSIMPDFEGALSGRNRTESSRKTTLRKNASKTFSNYKSRDTSRKEKSVSLRLLGRFYTMSTFE